MRETRSFAMKSLLFFAASLCAFSLHAASFDKRLISKLDHLFTPHGFDDNDVVEVIISGHFSSSCYQLGEALTRVDHDTKQVFITPISYRRDDVPCHQMVSHYSQVVKLGKMLAGEYDIKVSNNDNLNKVFNINTATANEQDDYLYPPVEYADVKKDSKGELTLLIKGRFPLMKRGCMVSTQSIVQFQDEDMLVVQPTAEVDLSGENSSEGCQQDFENTFKLPFSVQGEVLLHVRSINGQSYNRVIDLK